VVHCTAHFSGFIPPSKIIALSLDRLPIVILICPASPRLRGGMCVDGGVAQRCHWIYQINCGTMMALQMSKELLRDAEGRD
jgi:hypothetical protein